MSTKNNQARPLETLYGNRPGGEEEEGANGGRCKTLPKGVTFLWILIGAGTETEPETRRLRTPQRW